MGLSLKWTPEQLAQIGEMCAEGKGNATIGEIMGCDRDVIRDLRIKHGFPANPASVRKPVPDDFAKWAAIETTVELEKRYGVGDKPITRWRKETGVKPPKNPGPAKKIKEGALKPPAPVRAKTAQPRLARHAILWATQATQKDGSIPALARAYLRMTHSNVHDASIRYFDSFSDKRTWADVQNERFGLGIPDHGKGWSFVSGIGVVDDNTLMELAERKGFNREELAA